MAASSGADVSAVLISYQMTNGGCGRALCRPRLQSLRRSRITIQPSVLSRPQVPQRQKVVPGFSLGQLGPKERRPGSPGRLAGLLGDALGGAPAAEVGLRLGRIEAAQGLAFHVEFAVHRTAAAALVLDDPVRAA